MAKTTVPWVARLRVVVARGADLSRARAVALNIVIIHLVGDVPAPFLIGWASDAWGLKWAAAITLPALAAAAVLLLAALSYLKNDLAAAEQMEKHEGKSA